MIRKLTSMVVMLLMVGTIAMAQDDGGELPGAGGPGATISPLGVRQGHVRRMVQEMEDRFVKLSKALEPTEPEHARRIMDTLKAGKQALIEPRMAKVTQLLNAGQLEQAEQEQRKLVADVDKLIDLLTSTSDQKQREIEQLEQFYKDIEKLIGEQKDLKKETDIAQNREKTLNTIDQQIGALKELIEKQTDLKGKTDDARKSGAPAVMKLADEQAKLKRQTDALGKQIDQGPAGKGEAEDQAKSEGEGAKGEGSKGEESKGEGAKGEGSKGEESKGEGSKGEGAQGQESKAGEGSLGKATEHQREAEQKLGAGQGVSAGGEQGKALEEMKKALDKLEGERERIARLPADALPKLSEPEDKLADKTGELDKQMQAAGESGESGGGQEGEQSEGGKGTPGQPKVAEAQKQMKSASGKMQQQKGEEAKGDQSKAIAALKDAQKEIAERLRQLREETQEEKLAALEARFREMLSRQKPVTLSTRDVESARQSRPASENEEDKRPLTRPEKLQVTQLSVEENVLVEMAAKALSVIREDGTTVVLPEIVEQLHQDLGTTAKFLAGEQTGAYTQALQLEIEKTLEELIEALQKAQEQSQQQPPPPGEQGEQKPQQQPLVPTSAELKLLRSAQLRVNRRTVLFDTSRADVQVLPAELVQEVKRLSDRQEDVRKMTERLAERK